MTWVGPRGLMRRVVVRAALPIAGFFGYALAVWSSPVSVEVVGAESGSRGEVRADLEAWRSAGCQACHSIYGLGGHTGPDLTNVVGRSSGAYVAAMMRAGPPGMPSYARLSEDQTAAIVRYLTLIDRSGTYPSVSWRGQAGRESR